MMNTIGALTNIRSKKTYEVPMVIAERPPEFPWKWFLENKGKKPTCRMNIYRESDLTIGRQYAESFMRGYTTGISAVMTFLYHLLPTISEQLTTDWISYERKLSKGSTINPLSLLNIEIEEIDPPTVELEGTIDQTYDHSLLIGIVGLYRYANTHPSNQETISSRINPIIAQVRPAREGGALLINTSTGNSPLLVNNDALDIVLSALDMFLSKFPRNIYANARVGTIILRYSGCSALMDLNHFRKMLDCETSRDSLEWVFMASVGNEMDFMLEKNKDEISKDDSYFPYLLGLRLSQKSPYSAASCPTFHCIVHAVGSLLGIMRSINALLLDGSTPHLLAINAAIIFLANKRSLALAPTFVLSEEAPGYEMALRNKDLENEFEKNIDPSKESKQLPVGPREWYGYYMDRRFIFSKKDFEELQVAVSNVKSPRTGTVGEWVQTHFLSLLTYD